MSHEIRCPTLASAAIGLVTLLASCASTSMSTDPRPPAGAVVCPPDESDIAPKPTETDLKILRRADELLSGSSAWNHSGGRTCDPAERSWDLYCVLHRASLDVAGVACHRNAALQEVRWVVDDRTRGVELEHRLMDYNNLPGTTFADIKGVLAEAIARLSAKLHTP